MSPYVATSLRLGLALLAGFLALLIIPQPADASAIIGRNASGISLTVGAGGKALATFREAGRLRRVLAWGATGHGRRYRATAIGPGVSPDAYWEAPALEGFDPEYESQMNQLGDQLAARDSLCRQH